MSLFEVNFAARWFGLAAALTLAGNAAAQQAVEFSKPVGADPASTANAFMPEKSKSAPGAFNAPSSLFGNSSPSASFDVLPGSPPPDVSSTWAAQYQKSLDMRRNWTMTTPEEMFGIPTPEKILGIADPNDDPNLSVEERYLQRLNRQSAIGASNAMHRVTAPGWNNGDSSAAFLPGDNANSQFARTLGGSVPGSEQDTESLTGKRADGHSAADFSDSIWASSFDSPAPLSKPTQEQLKGMDDFRALLEEQVVRPAPVPGSSVQSAAAPDLAMPSMRGFNPAERSSRSFVSDIVQPTGVAPLPGIATPVAPPKKAPPLVQPPPWMQDPLQNSSLPQRQF